MGLFKGLFKRGTKIFASMGEGSLEQIMNTAPAILGTWRDGDVPGSNSPITNFDFENIPAGRYLVCVNFIWFLTSDNTTGTMVSHLRLNGDLIYNQTVDRFNWGETGIFTRPYTLCLPIDVKTNGSYMEFNLYGSGNNDGSIIAEGTSLPTPGTQTNHIQLIRIG